MKHQYLWIDLETTGLRPATCRILEWAVVLAADDRDGDMSPVQQYSAVLSVAHDSDIAEMDDCVRDMHTRNGLLKECFASTILLGECEEFLVSLCQKLTGAVEPKGIVLAGASVHFDLGFVRAHLPRFARCLSHRVLDVSTLKAAERTWGEPFADVKQDVHRALPDVLASLEEAKQLRERRWAL